MQKNLFRPILLQFFTLLCCLNISYGQTTYTVSNTSPTITTPNGLHWAIDQANNNPGVDIINFSIDGTIDMSTNTFVITEGVIIDGTTAPGYVAGTPSFILDRNGGIYINTSGSPTGIEINGLGFTNQNTNQNGSVALDLNSCTDLTIQNNVFTGISTAMDIDFGAEVSILNNDFNTTGYGSNRYTVEINSLTGTDPATRLKMTGNTFTSLGRGISLGSMDGLAINPTNLGTTEIHLPSGTFVDGVGLSLRINACDNVTLDMIDLSNTTVFGGDGVYVTNGNNIVIQNLTINNKSSGIRVENSNDVVIQDNTVDNLLVSNSAGRGILVTGGQDVEILDNTIRQMGRASNQYALTIDNVSDDGSGNRLIVNGTTFDGGGNGVSLANMDALTIDNVLTSTPGQGVHLPDADGRQGMYGANMNLFNIDNTTINNFDLSYTGGTTAGQGLITNGCDNLTVTNNTVNDRGQGISCTNSSVLLIQDNVIDNVLVSNSAGRGIWVTGGQDVEILDNTIRQMGRANIQFALTIDNVSDDGSGNRLIVNGTTFDGGGNGVSLANMDALTIDNVLTGAPGQGVHLPNSDGRQGMYGANMNLFNIDNTTINNFDLSYTGGTTAGSALNTNGCDNLTVTNNTVNDRGQGIYCLNSNDLLVKDNTVSNVLLANTAGRGIWISGGSDVEVLDNTINDMGRASNAYALTLNNVVDNGSGQRLVVNGNTFGGAGGLGVSIENMDALTIDNVASTGQGVHIPDTDGRQNVYGVNMNLFNIDNTTINNFDLSYTGGTVSGQALNTNACDGLTITNTTIDNRGQGIYCINNTALLVQDNEMDNVLGGNAGRGIWINGGSDVEILDNTITGFGVGNFIYALVINNIVDNGSGQRLVVNGTTFVGGTDGVSLENMDGLTIDNVASTGQGVHLPDGDGRQGMIGTNMQLSNIDNTTISNFDLSYSGGLSGNGLRALNCDDITIQDFTISGRGSGMYYQNCSIASILNNVISGGNGNGIEIFQGNNYLIQNNSVSDFTSGNNLAAYKYRNIVDDGMGNRLSALDNSFSNNINGIYVGSMDDMIISDGTVAGSEIILKTADNYGSDINGIRIASCTNTQIENLAYKGDASAVAGTAIFYDLSATSVTTGVSISNKGAGISINRNEGHVIQQSLFESNTIGMSLSTANVITNYTVANNNFNCNTEAIRANQFAVVDAANNFWGQNDGSSTDTGSGDTYNVTGNAPNTGVINNTTTILTSENTSVPIGGRKIFNGVTAQLTDGQTTTSIADSTDYETVNTGDTKTRQFRIVNSGIDSLHISSIVSRDAAFTIANAPDFVLCEDSVAFDVIFAPTAGTTYNSTITVNQEDCYNTDFEFAVAGAGFQTCDIAITSATPTEEVCPGADDGEIDVLATCTSCTSIEYSIDNFTTMNTTGDFTGLADGTYTVKVRDSGDNSCAAEMMNVVVGAGVDTEAPVVTAPANITVEVNNGCLSDNFTLGTATVTDNCNMNITPTNNAAANYAVGTHTVTWTADDGNGQTDTDDQMITVIASDINIQGSGMNITSGDDSPATGDDTDFGSITDNLTIAKTFTIQNTGTAALSGLAISLSGSSDFAVTTQPSASVITSGGSDLTFVVTYDPSDVGMDNATVTIASNDCDETSYTFDIIAAATANCDIAITSTTSTAESCPDADDGTITVTAVCNSCTNGNTDIEYSSDNTNWQSSNVLTGLADGNQTVYVRDANSVTCTDDAMETVVAGQNTTYYADTDMDGFGDPNVTMDACPNPPAGFVADNTDCDDTDGDEFPGQTWYIDADGDRYGGSSMMSCERPTDGFLLPELNANSNGTDDCDDADADEFPGQTWYIDEDMDGYGSSIVAACERPTDGVLIGDLVSGSTGDDDCDDTMANVNLGMTEIPNNNIDDNCNGAIDEVPTLSWVEKPNMNNDTDPAGCVSITDPCTQTYCFGLEYNPGSNGTLTSYTSGFTTSCNGMDNPIIYNESCVMTDNSNELVNCANGGVLMNSSGNNGSVAVTVNTPVVIHQICVAVMDEETKTFMEDLLTDISMSVTLNSGSEITEYPEFNDYTVEGNTPPTLTAGVIGSCYDSEASAEAAAILATTGTDDFSTSIGYTASTSGSCSATVTVTGADECGLTSTVTYATKIDGNAPTVSGSAFSFLLGCSASDIPAAVTTVADLLLVSATINIMDDCTANADLTVSHNDVITPGCPINITRTYTLTDECGNSTDLNHFFVVDDQTAPTITGSFADVTVDACGGASAAPAAATSVAALEAMMGTPSISDNCTADADIAVTHSDDVSGTCPVVIVRTYTISDNCNNENTLSHTIQVNPPDAIMEMDGPVATLADMQSVLYETPPPALPVIVDGCGTVLDPAPVVIGGTYQDGDCQGTITYTYTYEDCVGRTFDWVYTNNIDCGSLKVRVNLQGAYNGTDMDPELNVQHLLPGMDKSEAPDFGISFAADYTPFGQPYQGAPWNYTGNLGANYGESTSPGAPVTVIPYPDHVVDWILITVRENDTNETGDIFTCAGWLHTNGDVTFPEACPDVLNLDENSEYYIVVEHRNHLPVMDTAMIQNTNEYIEVDFASSDSYAPVFRFGQIDLGTGVWGMFSANVSQIISKVSINSADNTGWKDDQGERGYLPGDINMTGKVDSFDETEWKENQNITSGVKF